MRPLADTFSRVIDDLAAGKAPNLTDREELRQSLQQIERVSSLLNSFVIPGTNVLDFKFPIFTMYSNVLAEDAASLTIPIPTTHKHLLVMGAGRTNGSGTSSDYLLARFNGDTAGNYETQRFFANNTTLTGQKNTAQTSLTLGLLSQGGTAEGFVSSFYAFIPHYSTSYDKNILSVMMVGGIVFLVGARWDTGEPIRELTLTSGADDIAAGTAISVYGLG